MTLGDNRKTLRLTRTHFTSLPTGTTGSLVPALICHCEESSDVAIALRLDTRRRTVVATATRLPRYARNDIRGQSKDSAAHAYPLYFTTNGHHRLTPTHFTPPPTGAAGSLVPALICHCEERPLIPSSSRDVAISMRLDTRRRTVVATATRLQRYARNDKVGTHEALPGSVENVATPSAKSRPLPAWKMARVRLKPRLQSQNPVYPVYPCKTCPASPGPAQGPEIVGAPVDGASVGPQKILRYKSAAVNP